MSVDVVFWYAEEIVNKAYFTAKSKEEGEELLRQLNDGEISIDDLPNFYSKNKNYEVTIDEPMFFPTEKEGERVNG